MKLATLCVVIVLSMSMLLPSAFGAAEIIMDNGSATFVGNWQTGTMSPDKFGSDYRYIQVSTSGGSTATYSPNIPYASGDWAVYAWFPQGSNRPTMAQYIIHSVVGDSVVYLNQQANGGMWNYLGTYVFGAGTSNYARVTNYGSETTKVVLADAMRFYSVSANPDTTPPVITQVASNAGYSSAMITWTTDESATSQVEYGATSAYGSQTARDTNLVTRHCVTIPTLTTNTTYHYRVKSQDSSGNARASSDYTFTPQDMPTKGCFRGSWMDSWGNGFQTPGAVSAVIDQLHQSNYNAFIFEARKCGDACYNSSYEYKNTTISPQTFDPLADMIAKCHAYDMECHAWLVTYRIAPVSEANAPPIYFQHKVGTSSDWLMRDSAGNMADGTNYNFDPGVPGVQDYVSKVVMDIVDHYDMDGINFDYIRYPGGNWGYNNITRTRFYNEYGYYPPTSSGDSHWGVWCDYRRQQVTDLVRKCYVNIMAAKPRVKVSICGTTSGSITDFTGTTAYASVFQDRRKWMQDHIIDATMPMDYKREFDSTQAADYRNWCNFDVNNRWGRHTNIIQGSYLNSIGDTLTQLQYALDQAVDGICTYDYWSTNKDGQTKETFYSVMGSTIFPVPARIPDMPWKSAPTTGIIFGNVTDATQPNDPIYQNWIYKATVQVSGPVTQSALTDATGTYGFMDLPTGTYSVTVSKPGFMTRTYTGQIVRAGDVIREDFDIGYTTATSPAGTISAGYNQFSLPLDPVNPIPASVLSGIDLSGGLYRWRNSNQSQELYDMWAPEYFGNLQMDEGYMLYVDAPHTISYQAYGGTPGMRDIPLPTQGWGLVSCPLVKNANWEDVLVTKAGTTVDMRTAANTNNWLSSSAFYWDSVWQSQHLIGLPEMWPEGGTQMHPWYGYWVNTWTDGLTLTIKEAN